MANGKRRARALGGFSIALGAAQLLMPARLGALTGLGKTRGRRRLLRGVGLRELTGGLGLLSGAMSATWLWLRVAGDAIDLAIVGAALRTRKKQRRRLTVTAVAIGGVAALDLVAARTAGRRAASSAGSERSSVTRRSISIACAPEDAYRFWHNVENLPRVMPHLEAVVNLGNDRSHWRAQGPAGKSVEWDAEIVEDVPNRRIAWRSLPDADIDNAGTVRFVPAPGGRGTEVHVELRYDPPAGAIGTTVARLFGRAPGQEMDADLRAFKQLLETGEIARSDASLRPGPHAARPEPEPVHA